MCCSLGGSIHHFKAYSVNRRAVTQGETTMFHRHKPISLLYSNLAASLKLVLCPDGLPVDNDMSYIYVYRYRGPKGWKQWWAARYYCSSAILGGRGGVCDCQERCSAGVADSFCYEIRKMLTSRALTHGDNNVS
jgi:hypothetical protein